MQKDTGLLISWLLFLIFVPHFLSANQSLRLNELEVFNRCHLQLIGQPVDKSSEDFKLVLQGKISAAAACISTFKKANFDSRSNTHSANSLAAKILQRWQMIHQSFFQNSDLKAINLEADLSYEPQHIYDGSLAALYLTNSLFSSGQKPISEVLTASEQVFAIRDNSQVKLVSTSNQYKHKEMLMQNRFFYSTAIGPYNFDINQYVQVQELKAIDIPFGNLLGIKYRSELDPSKRLGILPEFIVDFGGGDKFVATANNTRGIVVPERNLDIYENNGAGVIGAPSYILTNIGYNQNFLSDGATRLARKWSKSVISDFLCRDIPVVRNQDVVQFLKPTSSVTFRNSVSCLKCHASIDLMAYTIRNIKHVTSTSHNGELRGFSALAYYKNTQPELDTEWIDYSDDRFHLRPTTGKFNYRTYDGELVTKKVQNINQLANEIKQLPDFEICLAKKYFKYMTGIDVALFDLGDPLNQSLITKMTASDKQARNFVVDLGIDLKRTQSAITIIEKIVNSEFYKHKNFKKESFDGK